MSLGIEVVDAPRRCANLISGDVHDEVDDHFGGRALELYVDGLISACGDGIVCRAAHEEGLVGVLSRVVRPVDVDVLLCELGKLALRDAVGGLLRGVGDGIDLELAALGHEPLPTSAQEDGGLTGLHAGEAFLQHTVGTIVDEHVEVVDGGLVEGSIGNSRRPCCSDILYLRAQAQTLTGGG